MADIYIPKGDKGFNINFTIRDSDGVVYDLSTYTVTLKVWKVGQPGTTLLSGACVLDGGGTTGQCHYVVASGSFDSVGIFKAELELTKTGVIESTMSFDIEVTESA
jgi:hypothetical protein